MSACVTKWLSFFWFDKYLESRAQLWQQGLPVGSTLHNGALCLPLSGNYLPFTSSFRDTLCWAPGLNPTRPGETRLVRMPLIQSGPFTPSVTLCFSALTYSPSDTNSCVSYHTVCSMLKSSPALSELAQLRHSLPPCHRHTHTHTHTHARTDKYNNDCSCFLLMLSLCSCWMRYGPFSICQRQLTQTYVHICTFPHNIIPGISLFFFPFSVFDKNTHSCTQSHTDVAARTLWPNSPRIDVCLSVKEEQHKEQRWACVWLRGNKEWSIPRQLSDSSGNTAWACLSYGHILSSVTVCSTMNNNVAALLSKSMGQIDLHLC